MISLKGKNILLTGATGGIGESIAERLAKEGCNLFLTSRTEDKLKKLSKKLKSKYKIKSFYYVSDFTHLIYYKEFEDIANKSKIDILINCAGLFQGNYDNMFDINVRLPYFLVKFFSKGMIKRKWGRIVNIGSISSYQGFPDTDLYCASKHALLGLSRSWRGLLKPHNIRVSFIAPSACKTNMGKQIPNQDYNTFIDPKEVAEYVLFIMKSDDRLIVDELKLNRFTF